MHLWNFSKELKSKTGTKSEPITHQANILHLAEQKILKFNFHCFLKAN